MNKNNQNVKSNLLFNSSNVFLFRSFLFWMAGRLKSVVNLDLWAVGSYLFILRFEYALVVENQCISSLYHCLRLKDLAVCLHLSIEQTKNLCRFDVAANCFGVAGWLGSLDPFCMFCEWTVSLLTFWQPFVQKCCLAVVGIHFEVEESVFIFQATGHLLRVF